MVTLGPGLETPFPFPFPALQGYCLANNVTYSHRVDMAGKCTSQMDRALTWCKDPRPTSSQPFLCRCCSALQTTSTIAACL